MRNKSETLSFRVPDNTYRQIYDIAINDRRKLSEVALGLLERGLAAHLRDGRIFEPGQSSTEDSGIQTPFFPGAGVSRQGSGILDIHPEKANATELEGAQRTTVPAVELDNAATEKKIEAAKRQEAAKKKKA